MIRALILAGFIALASSGQATAADDAVLGGAVTTPVTLSGALLGTLPQSEVSATFETSKGSESGHYRGVLLWTLVERAGLLPLSAKNGDLQRTLLVTGRDGYAAALALGEIDPHYEGKAVLLVPDGAGGVNLLVPGDRHGGRNVRDIVRIDVR